MNRILRRLRSLLTFGCFGASRCARWCIVSGLISANVFGQELGQGTGRQAERVLASAIENLESVPSLSAKIRQRVDMQGESLVGSGTYQQAVYGKDSLFRIDLKIPLGTNLISTLLQVCDGRYVWTYRQVPGTNASGDKTHRGDNNNNNDEPSKTALNTQVSFVDLNRVRSETQAAISTFGGIPHTLRQISRRYEMKSVVGARLQELAVWKLYGQLKERTVAGEDENSVQHSGTPEFVFLMIGQDDAIPYRIEFRDRLPESASPKESIVVTARERQAIAMDFFEVQVGTQFDPSIFEFRAPGNVPIEDTTPRYLADLRN